MIVAQPSTPANHFHLLRRQAYQRPRRPLIVFTPKQLLRLRQRPPRFHQRTFQPGRRRRSRLVTGRLCSGRVYYDLLSQRSKQGRGHRSCGSDYPLPAEDRREIAKYGNAELMWVQDEPENQGPWGYLALNLPEQVSAVSERGIRVVSREPSAAPSAGTMALHKLEQEELLTKAFAK